MKRYVVMEIGYEYNDEDYTKQEGGEPTKIFAKKSDADATAHRMSLNKLLELDYPKLYGVEISNELDFNNMLKSIDEEFDTVDENDYEWNFPSDLTTEQLEKLLPFLSYDFFSVVEVESDE